MATKSFQTDFRFTAKSANALANALSSSKRVDVNINRRVTRYHANDTEKLKKFDSLFNSHSGDVHGN
ncbi:hypothetical protein [Lacticaseibacillus paracasei]|uniref:hypothetical protein n=1 Tax=Lacticaseibacillus paracasei TaxID=1597 RepID=UPI0021D2BE74|nr:hypothetical protein [Lacticaseibacillus paracasei]MCU6430256.1 hypothetical protein [Lacticaseibacillus paracasei]